MNNEQYTILIVELTTGKIFQEEGVVKIDGAKNEKGLLDGYAEITFRILKDGRGQDFVLQTIYNEGMRFWQGSGGFED